MAIEFYNVKKREKVSIDESAVKKVKYERSTGGGPQVRYAFQAVDDDGTKLTKFCSEDAWKALDAPEA